MTKIAAAPPPLVSKNTKEIDEVNLKINMIVDKLSYAWSLCLQTPKFGDSPSKRLENPRTIEQEIVFKIKALCFRNAIDPLILKFQEEAHVLYSGWVHKPKAERGVVPERMRHSRIAVTERERVHLLKCLLDTLTEAYDAKISPKKQHPMQGNAESHLDDSPISFQFSKPKTEPKRSRELEGERATFKKPRLPEQATGSFSATQFMQDTEGSTQSANTSFTSIFSNPQFNTSNKSLPEVFTQETAVTQSSMPSDKRLGFNIEYREPGKTSFEKRRKSSNFEVGNSFDANLLEAGDTGIVGVGQSDPAVDNELSQDLMEHAAVENPDNGISESGEDEIKERLCGIFPKLPSSLRNVPLCVAYEITRVFLYAEVSLSEVEFSSSLLTTNYDALWRVLKSLPALRGKVFPERCSRETWDAAIDDFHCGNRAVYMNASLHFSFSDESSPLFYLRLGVLRLDASHRCGRRFGHDRFLEIDMPNLSDRRAPKSVQQAGKRGAEIIIEWLVDESHHLLDRVWKPFHLKAKDRRDRKTDFSQYLREGPELINRLFFFAVDGNEFIELSPEFKYSKPYMKLDIDRLLNRIRPTNENFKQPFLKLFSRTSIALSRNTPTVILERNQIRYHHDIYSGLEVMTDGAGRISWSLAATITKKLGLSYFPSGFQGRFGEAKGFWSVDNNDKSGEDWIEVYDSQCKWNRSSQPKGESEDPSHLTFEVLKCAGPLKSADLNLQFLPLLIDRARSPKLMKDTLKDLLVHGLNREIETLQIAMDSPEAFRKWIREINPSIKDRVRARAVTYRAGLPVRLDERLNVLLDAGFDPKNLYFMKDMARSMLKSKCEDLKKKLNITVGRSTYVYMIPDFAGVLEPNQVYLDFSSFVDYVSGFSGVRMDDVDILVARSPAHYVSDIQKVKAVLKVELMGLKDVIVFSTKGNPSLAAKLSGGDYDGDIAWVCWEPALVDNFINAEVPKCPNLVEEGFIRKETTTYEQLVSGHSIKSSVFLKKSFAFNMDQSLLGICTNYKEDVCYHLGSVNTTESIFLSTLLSLLVDQSKQGNIFNEDDWTCIKRDVIRFTPQKPSYKTDYIDPKSNHIIDQLMLLAKQTIEAKLTEFHRSLPDPPQWDEDLAAYYKWARGNAEVEPQWATILNDLDADLKVIKKEWQINFNRAPTDESKPDFLPFVMASHAKFHAIAPHKKTPLSQSLLPECFPDPEVTSWALLKASAFFASYRPSYVASAVWWLAGKQLLHLKCMSHSGMAVVASNMYAMLKPDSTYVRALTSENEEALAIESKNPPVNVVELEILNEDD